MGKKSNRLIDASSAARFVRDLLTRLVSSLCLLAVIQRSPSGRRRGRTTTRHGRINSASSGVNQICPRMRSQPRQSSSLHFIPPLCPLLFLLSSSVSFCSALLCLPFRSLCFTLLPSGSRFAGDRVLAETEFWRGSSHACLSLLLTCSLASLPVVKGLRGKGAVRRGAELDYTGLDWTAKCGGAEATATHRDPWQEFTCL